MDPDSLGEGQIETMPAGAFPRAQLETLQTGSVLPWANPTQPPPREAPTAPEMSPYFVPSIFHVSSDSL